MHTHTGSNIELWIVQFECPNINCSDTVQVTVLCACSLRVNSGWGSSLSVLVVGHVTSPEVTLCFYLVGVLQAMFQLRAFNWSCWRRLTSKTMEVCEPVFYACE